MNETVDPGLESLYRIEKFMGSMTDLNGLLRIIISEACLACEAESCSLALYDEKTDDLFFYAAEGTEGAVEQQLQCIRLKKGSGIIVSLPSKPPNATPRTLMMSPKRSSVCPMPATFGLLHFGQNISLGVEYTPHSTHL